MYKRQDTSVIIPSDMRKSPNLVVSGKTIVAPLIKIFPVIVSVPKCGGMSVMNEL